MIYPVIIYPHKNLRLKSRDLSLEEIESNEIQQLINDLKETMIEKDGLGLAAPQIDKQINLIAINTDSGVLEFINPKIIKKSWAKNTIEEGCLSLPNIYGLVKRPSRVKVSYLDKHGKQKTISDDSITARVLQHEIDHLNGTLFIDLASKITHGADNLDEVKKLAN